MSCSSLFRAPLVALILLGFGMTSASGSAVRGERPLNIVFILADDHGTGAVSSYGSRLIETPNIDRIGREGVRFTRMFATNSICTPARATILTGTYSHINGVKRLEDRFNPSLQTFPRMLQQAGYQTAIFGKWHLSTEPVGFDHFAVVPGQGRFFDPVFKVKGRPWESRAAEVVQPGYLTDVLTDLAVGWLEGRDREKPFCLLVHHKAPHSPHEPAPRHASLFADTMLPEPANLLDEYTGRAPESVADGLQSSRLVLQSEPQYAPLLKGLLTGDRETDTRAVYQLYFKNHLRLIASLDENVGRVLDYLDKTGLSENTVVVYTSDNGFLMGEHGLFNKMWMYEESSRIPLLVRVPHRAEGARNGVNDAMLSMIDFAPTMLEVAGLPVPAEMQGRSFWGAFSDRGVPEPDRPLYYHYYGFPEKGEYGRNLIRSHQIVGVRTVDEKLIYYPDWNGEDFWEYFDLRADPAEMNNRFRDPAVQNRVGMLRQKLLELAEHYRDDEVSARLRR